jgi:peroxiredoxin
MARNFVKFFVVSAMLAALAIKSESGDTTQEPSGLACPDFTLKTVQGTPYTLSGNLGQGPIVINFWATWCTPCAAEMKKLDELYQSYKARGLQVVSISIDDSRTQGKVANYVRSHKLPFTVLLDPNREVMTDRLQLQAVPHVLLLDKEGKIAYQHSGYRNGDELELKKRIEQLVGQKGNG